MPRIAAARPAPGRAMRAVAPAPPRIGARPAHIAALVGVD
jgi:hypothetical protein